MNKNKLYKCYYCKCNSLKEKLLKVETEKTTKKGIEIIRYYHPECLSKIKYTYYMTTGETLK